MKTNKVERWTALSSLIWRQSAQSGCVSFYLCKYQKGSLPDNMKSHKGRHILNLEITGAFLAVCAGLLGMGIDRWIPLQAYLPVIVGLLITASAMLLKFEL